MAKQREQLRTLNVSQTAYMAARMRQLFVPLSAYVYQFWASF